MENKIAKEESKINLSSNSNVVNSPLISTPRALLAWCSNNNNMISVIDLETKQNYVTFGGAKISNTDYSSTFLKEIPNTKLIVSLHHNHQNSAEMEIFDISKKGKANKIYSLGKVSGSKLDVGYGDVTYNARRGILGAIPVTGRIDYHLFNLDDYASNTKEIVKLNRKTKWHSPYNAHYKYVVTGFDFNPAGDFIATIDNYGVCKISDVDTNDYGFHLRVGKNDLWGRCRWSINAGEPLLFVKYEEGKLNILDVEKRVLTLSNPVQLDYVQTYWIDVCQSDANLLASSGSEKKIRIFDKRESKIVKTFKDVHSRKEFPSVPVVIHYLDEIYCVRWHPSGGVIASASADKTASLLDFTTGKVLHTGTTSDGSLSASFNKIWTEKKTEVENNVRNSKKEIL